MSGAVRRAVAAAVAAGRAVNDWAPGKDDCTRRALGVGGSGEQGEDQSGENAVHPGSP